MNPTNHPCDSIQQEISAALDEGMPLPSHLTGHLAGCQDCQAFLEFWTGTAAETLTRELPPAGVSLRHRILAMPAQAAPMRSEVPRPDPRRSFQRVLSAVAAVMAIAFVGYSLIDIRPADTAVAGANSGTSPVAKAVALTKELAALDSDFKQGVGELRAPMRSLQYILNR